MKSTVRSDSHDFNFIVCYDDTIHGISHAYIDDKNQQYVEQLRAETKIKVMNYETLNKS